MKSGDPGNSEPSALWVLTSYFNPAGYRRRLANYRLFRQHLAAPLLTVEMSTDHHFVLNSHDADVLIQCPAGDVMWQKERLLNHALSHLPDTCRYVAWVDCDLLFGSDDWVRHVETALQHVPLLQPFSRVFHSPNEAHLQDFGISTDWMSQPSVGEAISTGLSFEHCMASVMQRTTGTVAVGMAWAARRELLERHGLFDASIIGGGDTAMVCAAFGRPELAMDLHHMNARQRSVYRAWAESFHQAVKGAVTHTSGTIVHLWHGEVQDRRPTARHRDLGLYDFDPARDIAFSEHGPWRWATHKPDLHAYLKHYFASRKEDGYVKEPCALTPHAR